MEYLTVEIKAIIANEKLHNTYTLYLFSPQEKIIIPIQLTKTSAETITKAQQKILEPRPCIHNTVNRLIKGLDSTVDKVIIHHYDKEIYYTYICLKKPSKKGPKFVHIDAKLSDAISIASRANAPIVIKKRIAEKTGIKITKELLTSFTNI